MVNKQITMAQQTESEKGSLLNTERVPLVDRAIQQPFSIDFYCEGKGVKIQFKKSEDILKLGELLSKYLTENGIENTLETYSTKI